MNNEELEQELRTILSNVEFMHGVPVSAPKKTVDDVLQFILSREEKQKQRIIDFMKIDAEIAVKQERQRMKERLENDSVRNAKASGDYERGYDHGFDDCKKLALLEE